MEKTYTVLVAFENCRVGDTFSVEETVRLRMLVASGYLREIRNPFLGVEIADDADLAAAVAEMEAKPRRRTAKTATEASSEE